MRLEAGDGAPTKQVSNALRLQARLAIAAFTVTKHAPVRMTASRTRELDTGQAARLTAADGAPTANVSAFLTFDQHAVCASVLD
jgi:hypothetical protein